MTCMPIGRQIEYYDSFVYFDGAVCGEDRPEVEVRRRTQPEEHVNDVLEAT